MSQPGEQPLSAEGPAAPPERWLDHVTALAGAVMGAGFRTLGLMLLSAIVLAGLCALVASDGSWTRATVAALVALVACGIVTIPLIVQQIVARASVAVVRRSDVARRLLRLIFDLVLKHASQTTNPGEAAEHKVLVSIGRARELIHSVIEHLDHQRERGASWPRRMLARLIRHRILVEVERFALDRLLLDGPPDGQVDLAQVREELAARVHEQVTGQIRSAARRTLWAAIGLAGGASLAVALLIRLGLRWPLL